ncbi:hypothetical protein GQF61_02175 [Sphingobacterium sp. DK4209]|uniref:Lipoprotein n=1 Tax=Sphingobacterium zhuxiongii TaxID=2662364 RepID=A0A5Q0QBP8_9SPHI|nr:MULTISPECIES: HmuY family protein [unclassified Sphingobacterium]MVZ64644.1 hypothetical protein [Sphingobacterium sp. DK4209]QGA26983.1 hypothetical protein GFH32_11930 [Sphingobacterium sp. dk4302]
MNYSYIKRLSTASLCCLLLFSACEKEEKPIVPDLPVQEEKVVLNLLADYKTRPFFKFSTGEVVSKPTGDNWDIRFDNAQLKINGGNMSNPVRSGNGKGIIIHTAYQNVKEIPNLSELKQDNGREDYALGYRSGGTTWYFLDDNNFYIIYPEKTLFIQTADGKGFVKLQIFSFYRDMPSMKGETYDSMSSRMDYFSFRYQYIEKGQRFH